MAASRKNANAKRTRKPRPNGGRFPGQNQTGPSGDADCCRNALARTTMNIYGTVCVTVLSLMLAGWASGADRPASGFAVRGTLPWHNFLSGPTAWDEPQYEQYLDRMAQLGLNYIAFHCYTGGAERYATYVEPLIRIAYRDVVPHAGFDTSLTARWGYRPLAVRDFAFGTGAQFPVPEFAQAFGARCAVLARTNDLRYSLAQSLMSRVIDLAHQRGIQVALGFEFGIHPPEFSSIVPPSSWIRGAMLPDPTHPASITILRNTLDDILAAYPRIDWIWLWLHEHTMYVGKPRMGPHFQRLFEKEARHFPNGADESLAFTGVWSLAYIRLAHAYLAERAPHVRLAISGWGGGTQLPALLQGLDRALATDIVFTCLNPAQGLQPHPDVLADIAKHRPVWAIPWLEGDAQLWHPQPRVSLLRRQVRLAYEHKLAGLLAIHWRTEETRANLDAFAQFARDPHGAPTVEAFYEADCRRRFGPEAVGKLAPLLTRIDREQWFSQTTSPEYFAYDPGWGRLKPPLRDRIQDACTTVSRLADASADAARKGNLRWLAADLRFTLLLDEVGQCIEPAYRLEQRTLRGDIDAESLAREIDAARKRFDRAPIEQLFRTYAGRIRSRGELGVLSALNQKLWLQYRPSYQNRFR